MEVPHVHSSMIGKVEKAMRYAHEPDRVKLSAVRASFAGDNGTHTVTLDAQLYVIPFYEALGFTAEGDTFLDAGIKHRRMTRSL